MAVEGSSAVYWGGTVSYNTKKGLPFLMNDAQLQRRLLDNPLTRGTWESEAELYVRTKLQATAEIATAFLEAAGTDYAIAEGGAAGPTFRQEGLTSGFSALTIARWGRDGAAEIASQALVNSKTADREGNMELFAASAAEELLRVMDEEDEEASGSFIFYPPDPVPSPVIRISPSSFPTVGGATTTTAERPAEGEGELLDRCVLLRDDAEAVAALRASEDARFVVVVDGGAEILTASSSEGRSSGSSGGSSSSAGNGGGALSLALLPAAAAEALLADGASLGDTTFLGKFRGAPLFMVDAPKEVVEAAEEKEKENAPSSSSCTTTTTTTTRVNTRTHAPLLPLAENRVALAAAALATWHRRAKHCTHCGTAVAVKSSGHMLKCGGCGAVSFPRQDPAVIAVVGSRDGRKVLLARSPRRKATPTYT
jgi:NADH pyrophosphatase NudC (nudix superfamily)/nicotinamide mononucleotide (NMN) deamidase PncC